MKKNLLIVVFLSGVMSAQEVVFFEDFNGDLEGWETLDRDRDGTTWEGAQGSFVTKDAGFGGDEDWLMSVVSYDMLNGTGPLDSDDILISPIIKIPKTGNISLTYKIGVVDTETYMMRNMNDITYQFFVLEEGQTFYPTLIPLDEKNFKDSSSAEEKTFDLNDFRGKSIRLYWRQKDAFGQFTLLLDNVKVIREGKSSVFPNPTEDLLYLEGFREIISYKIYSMSGRLMNEGRGRVEIVNVSHLTPGVYVIVVEDIVSREPKSYKFIKK